MSSGPGDTGWQSPYTQSTPDPKAVRAKRIRNGLIVLAIIGLVAFAAGWNPPTTTVHKFTKSSNYKPDRESGCTNSGEGCHGSEKSYKDFNVYHPNAKCTTCHDYQGVGCIPCHMPAEKECPLCHDGTMKQAPDVVKLTDPYPRGHYRETTHTAMGTAFDDEMRAAEDGKAAATCADCHSRDLKKAHTGVPVVEGSTYGADIGCGECHNDTRAGSLAQVKSKWKGHACADCHKQESSSPQHAIDVASAVEARSTLNCGSTGTGCHDVNDLHALHKDKPKTCSGSAADGEKGCHVLDAEAVVPQGISCGGTGRTACHRMYSNTTYSHKRDAELHSPATETPASDTSFWDTPCGGCHRMAPDGMSLVDEHAIDTSARTEDPSSSCMNCHNSAAAADAIAEDWSDRDTTMACSACHGMEGLPAAHEGNLTDKHVVDSRGCSDSGAGCHPTNDLMQVGKPSTTANIHRDCLRCHDWTESDGNNAYNPTAKTCGEGRACHAAAGAYSTVSYVHDGAAGRTDGFDGDHHRAGIDQATAVYDDSASGLKTACNACHSMTLQTEHARSNSSIARGTGTLCARCHNADKTASAVVKTSWERKDSTKACSSCHPSDGARAIHGDIALKHAGKEYSPSGTPAAGSCATSGCHATLDLRVLHKGVGCTVNGCHTDSANILGSGIVGCGGNNPNVACHAGFSRTQHFVDFAADVEGTVGGVHYDVGSNVGCFGCHVNDLNVEHANALAAGVTDGGGATTCALCHDDVEGPGAYAGLPRVKSALANHDKRCIACHASGSATDGPVGVASPHKDTSTADPLTGGKVWSDPFADWKAAFDSPTGSGHNSLSSSFVGGATDKKFPVTEFEIGGDTYTWALPPNSGSTTWLDASAFPAGATDSMASIRNIQVLCDDCHELSSAMNGPHGSAVPIAIEPAYSQTEYANPTRTASQFEATGTRRVVCFKCHTLYVGGVDGSAEPGGASLHAKHVEHSDLAASDKHRYGEACVDCHVRVPHAWRRPRLLVRTVATTDGAVVDTYPYVLADHDGLLGVRLRSFDPQTELKSGSCVTGGCHPTHSTTQHPLPSDVPTATYWP